MPDLQMVPFGHDNIEHNGKQKPNEEEFCKDVEAKFTPYVGQEFLEIEEVVTFYRIYAVTCGFDVQFDAKWEEIGREHNVNNIDWFQEMFAKRRQWVMAHCRDLDMGGVMRTTQRSESENSFFKRFESKSGTLVEFTMRFYNAMDKAKTHTKQIDNRNRHVSEISTHLAIEVHGAEVYSHKVFEEFKEEAKWSIGTCKSRGFTECGSLEVTTVRDASRERNYEVTYCQIAMSVMWSEIHQTVGLLMGKLKNDVENFSCLIRQFKEKLSPLGSPLNKRQQLEKILGCSPTEEITILPPKKSKNKGSGKRMLSKKEKAIALARKPKRMCKSASD
ncbi:protein FAR-RED ELONGATED HYPOCOTYL 3-like [Silene latifolia]|uniref:protein FAR-RED ELONGATED HYPOCOTYL 3-like n=1 Tax=Silene latifolia TaxID=37657 RepID=UPI003D76B619